MEIRELRYILAIAKHQNLTKAAEELFISQSALTKFLHKYEEENNLTLFIKVGNRFILSENGKVFVKKADEILRMHDLFVRELGTLKNEVKYSLQGTTQGRYLTGGVPPVRFSMLYSSCRLWRLWW